MDLSSTKFSAKRLSFTAFTPVDAPDSLAAATPRLTRYMGWDPSPSLQAFERVWQAWLPLMVEGTDAFLVVRLTSNQEFLGMAGLHNINASEPELGIWIKEEKQGCGYGREAVAAVISFASRALGKKAVVYPVVEQNTPSRHLAESLGGNIIGKAALRKSDRVTYPQVIYRITAR